ncbi:hypothetical protein KDX21_22435 [Burkholderia cenocepacia]|nr:hypothetical protein [Burkholderia cenocepacia]HEM7803847.1 hypothetical protein [Burkholderia cenocepacia]
MNRTEAAIASGDEAHFGLFDPPVHAGGTLPDFEPAPDRACPADPRSNARGTK